MKSALIIVDGMSVAYRSEVANAILAKFPKDTAEIFNCSYDTPLHLYVHMMRNVLDRRRTVILNSSWATHEILETLGQPVNTIKEYRRMLDRIALGCDAQWVLCAADAATYVDRWFYTHNDNENYPLRSIEDMHDAWIQYVPKGLGRMLMYTMGGVNADDIELLMDRVMLKSGSNVGPGIGNWAPGMVILLVGDRHGPSIQPYAVDANIAFCDMAKAGSSYWLSQQLEAADIPESKLYWINAYDKEDIPADAGFVQSLKPVAVLTLGDSASRWCESNAIKYEGFTHPQYHKRFHFKEPYPLISRLADLVKGN